MEVKPSDGQSNNSGQWHTIFNNHQPELLITILSTDIKLIKC